MSNSESPTMRLIGDAPAEFETAQPDGLDRRARSSHIQQPESSDDGQIGFYLDQLFSVEHYC
jgi:hypothetical protein